MKKVAIVTLFDYTNIGNKLQNYAVQTLVSDMGYESVTLLCDNLFFRENRLDKIKICSGYFLKKYKKLFMDKERKKIFKKSTENLIKTTPIYTWSEIQNLDVFDAYVAGSDQVWHNWLHKEGELEFRFLTFAHSEKIICFSPSFGVDCIEDAQSEIFKMALGRFHTLSCREESGCKIIKKLIGRDATLLNDPTMMLEVECWNKICKKPDFNIPDKYVLVYCLSKLSPEDIKDIQEYIEKNACAIIDIYNIDYPQYYNTTPQEFLYLLNNAEYVFTNSFHGTVFSILYNKKFTCYMREEQNARMNNRVVTLLNKVGLSDRIKVVSNEDIDYKKINKIVKEEREKGIRYLSDELKRVLNGNG